MSPVYNPGFPPVMGTQQTLLDIIAIAKKAGIPIHVGVQRNSYVYTGSVKPGYLYISSTKRTATSDWHGYNMAVDFSAIYDNAGKAAMEKLAKFMYAYNTWLLEEIHKAPTAGYYVKNGNKVSATYYGSQTVSQHANHVHIAMSPKAARELRAKLYPPPAPAVYHTVVAGDTLSGIAKQYGTTVDKLLALNPTITDPNTIYPGQRIRVK